jgi:glycosyltransferase involved in cell wall biosynthesis
MRVCRRFGKRPGRPAVVRNTEAQGEASERLTRRKSLPSYPFAVIVPVYNHPQKIAAVLREALSLGVPVICVDDGSTDGTPDILQAIPGITVMRHPRNLGKGAALLTGFAAAAPLTDWAVTLDGDGQHRPDEALRLLQVVPQGLRPIVVGHRQNMRTQPAPWTSRFGRKFSNFWVRCAGGPALGDTQSGFRLYPLPEVLALPVRARRFQYEVEVLVQARRRGIPCRETPITVSYPPRGLRISHFRPFRDFLRNAGTFSRLIFLRTVTAGPKSH